MASKMKIASICLPPGVLERVQALRQSGRGFNLSRIAVAAIEVELAALERGEAGADPAIEAAILRRRLAEIAELAKPSGSP